MNSHADVSRRSLVLSALGVLGVGRSAVARASRAPHQGQGADHSQGPGVDVSQESADSSVATLSKPWLAGQPRARVTDGDNDPFVIAIERRVKCNCGCAHSLYGCRTTDFVCGFWQPLHAQVVEMANRGMSAEEIIDAYVAEHGTQYLMAPPPEGFNLAGYLVPGIVITLAGGLLAMLLGRRSRVAAAEAAVTDTDGRLSAAEQDLLAAELEKLDP